ALGTDGAQEAFAIASKARGHGSSRDAMLPRSGLRGDARFVHPDRKQRLAERVIHLMRAGMAEVFAFQINFRAAEALAQIRGEIERRRPSHEFARAALELVAKFRISARFLICALEFVQR